MKSEHGKLSFGRHIYLIAWFAAITTVSVFGPGPAFATDPPRPLLVAGHPVDWWFVFKFNTATFPNCSAQAERHCIFGGEAQEYTLGFSEQFVFASSDNPSLREGTDCLGDTTADPVGATFDEVYNGAFFYLIWNDQFYQHPQVPACPNSNSCGAPWGHSKGLLAWNENGDGFVMQVTTPSWPAAGSKNHARQLDGNTLGCVKDDNVLVSQHFFALKVTKDDVVKVLKALGNASVVTDPTNPQIVNKGGPQDIQALVDGLGVKSTSKDVTVDTLSSGVKLISKPSGLHVPPWQLVSSLLGSVPLRVATWWTNPAIPSTDATTNITCWDPSLQVPGRVSIATTGEWNGQVIGLTGGLGKDRNHAKIGVSLSGEHPFSVFGDMNQQGALTVEKCGSSQNGRGGLFYVIDNAPLFNDMTKLIAGDTNE